MLGVFGCVVCRLYGVDLDCLFLLHTGPGAYAVNPDWLDAGDCRAQSGSADPVDRQLSYMAVSLEKAGAAEEI